LQLRRLEDWSARFEQRISQHPVWSLILLSLLYFLPTFAVSRVKLMWFDELITLYVLRFHSFGQLWATLKSGIDLNPPFFHLIARASEMALGENALALRLPCMVAFWAATVCVFEFVRRRTSVLYGLGAALFLLTTDAYFYAYEARPYAIVLACCAAMLVCWQRATEAEHRTRWLAGLALALAVAVSSHYYAVLLAAPLAAGEVVRSASRRKIDWPVWAALALGPAPLLLFLPLIRVGMTLHKNQYVWNKPEGGFVWEAYGVLIGYGLLLMVPVLIGWMLQHQAQQAAGKASRDRARIPAAEVTAGLVLCALPVLAYAVAVAFIGMITFRYVLPAVCGFAVMFGFAAYGAGRASKAVGFALVPVLLAWFFVHAGIRAHMDYAEHDRFAHFESQKIVSQLDLPMVVQEGLLTLSMAYYAPPEIRSRLTFLVDMDAVDRFKTDDTAERLLVLGRNTFPIRQQDLNEFRGRHRKYLLYGVHAGWLIDALARDGAEVRLLQNGKYELLFSVDDRREPRREKAGARPSYVAHAAAPVY